ncbi:MAG TPA: chromate transporter [Pyrinomonadaceae bacterium]|nr:chromate transporter [Pyrinomonadaceae bacterium]
MPSQSDKRVDRIKVRTREMRARVRYSRREIRRISRTATLGGLFLSFLKIGLVGFGGGLAVIAQVRTLTVRKRRWLTDVEFAEGFALAQSLPGTAAGNIVTYVGLKLRGWRGAGVAMAGFILPSTLLMIGLAILYRHLRYLPKTDQLFHGLNAALVGLIAVTAWRMGKSTLNKRWQWVVGVMACLTVVIIGATVVEVVLAAGVIGIFIDSFAERQLQKWWSVRNNSSRRRGRVVFRMISRRRKRNAGQEQAFIGGYLMRALAEKRVEQAAKPSHESESHDSDGVDHGSKLPPKANLNSIAVLGLALPIIVKLGLLLTISAVFLRIGSITFGGGFVMIPLIESEVVNSHHWLTHQEFADATALGQVTPGPVLISAAFIGYQVAGTLGALVATTSIFLPSFLMTIVAGSSLRRFRDNQLVQSFLRGVTPAVVGLLVAAAISIGRAGIHTSIGLLLAAAAAVVLLRFRPNPFWVILGAGTLRFLLGIVLW